MTKQTFSALLSVLAALTLLAGLVVPNPAFAGETLVKEFRGVGVSDTRPFEVGNGWEIQWESSEPRLLIFVYAADGELITDVAAAANQKSGRLYFPEGGTYFLRLHGDDKWVIRVVDID